MMGTLQERYFVILDISALVVEGKLLDERRGHAVQMKYRLISSELFTIKKLLKLFLIIW